MIDAVVADMRDCPSRKREGGGWKRLTERKGWGMSEIAGRLTWRLATFASFPTKDDDQEYSRMCAVLVVDGNKKRCRGIWL